MISNSLCILQYTFSKRYKKTKKEFEKGGISMNQISKIARECWNTATLFISKQSNTERFLAVFVFSALLYIAWLLYKKTKSPVKFVLMRSKYSIVGYLLAAMAVFFGTFIEPMTKPPFQYFAFVFVVVFGIDVLILQRFTKFKVGELEFVQSDILLEKSDKYMDTMVSTDNALTTAIEKLENIPALHGFLASQADFIVVYNELIKESRYYQERGVYFKSLWNPTIAQLQREIKVVTENQDLCYNDRKYVKLAKKVINTMSNVFIKDKISVLPMETSFGTLILIVQAKKNERVFSVDNTFLLTMVKMLDQRNM